MANVRDFRTRIRSVRSTQQITRAMKLVAAAKLRRAQDRIVAARPYARKMLEVLSSLAARAHPDRHPLLIRRPEGKILLIVVTADKGMCGSFNTNIVNAARNFLDERLGRSGPVTGSVPQVFVDNLGRKGRDWFRRRDYQVRRVLVDIFKDVKLEGARDIASNVIEGFTSGEFDSVHLVYNEFKSIMQQRVVVETLLPIPRADFDLGAGAPESRVPEDYLYEPDQETLFAELLPKHVMIQVHRILLESAAAEHGARMTAMENATRNAGEMIDSLTLQMNKIRQASITKEILEVVSGAEALK
jgi:F-type H+-transporting ATPase subunit gamma